MSYPNSLDSFTDPSGTDFLNSPDHANQHINKNTAIESIETKLGIDSSADSNSIDYFLKHASGTFKLHDHTNEANIPEANITMNTTTGHDHDGTDSKKVAAANLSDYTAWTTHTPVFAGFSANPSAYSSRYLQIGKTVIWKHMPGTGGTSNATTFTMTLPVTAGSSAACWIHAGVRDNGTWGGGGIGILANDDTVITLGKVYPTTGAFTNSGTKDTAFILIYEAA